MKLPNGYGSVTKLSGNRRNPFMVRKTIGWNEKGYPIYQPIGYTKTREDGLIMLAQYNNDPWNIDAHKMTLQDCIDNCNRGYSTQGAIKNLFGHLDNFALEIDVINKSYAQLITSAPIPETTKDRLSDDQIDQIWDLYESGKYPWCDSILVFIYSGFRISELLDLKCENIDLENRTFIGGTKTKAGKDRIVPIHSLIYDIVKKRKDEGNTYLFSFNGKHTSKATYYAIWYEIMDQLGEHRTPHECRHTFRSLLDSAGANKKCIDMMMGHKSKDVGERRYTHKTIEELRDAIELIKR